MSSSSWLHCNYCTFVCKTRLELISHKKTAHMDILRRIIWGRRRERAMMESGQNSTHISQNTNVSGNSPQISELPVPVEEMKREPEEEIKTERETLPGPLQDVEDQIDDRPSTSSSSAQGCASSSGELSMETQSTHEGNRNAENAEINMDIEVNGMNMENGPTKVHDNLVIPMEQNEQNGSTTARYNDEHSGVNQNDSATDDQVNCLDPDEQNVAQESVQQQQQQQIVESENMDQSSHSFCPIIVNVQSAGEEKVDTGGRKSVIVLNPVSQTSMESTESEDSLNLIKSSEDNNPENKKGKVIDVITIEDDDNDEEVVELTFRRYIETYSLKVPKEEGQKQNNFTSTSSELSSNGPLSSATHPPQVNTTTTANPKENGTTDSPVTHNPQNNNSKSAFAGQVPPRVIIMKDVSTQTVHSVSTQTDPDPPQQQFAIEWPKPVDPVPVQKQSSSQNEESSTTPMDTDIFSSQSTSGESSTTENIHPTPMQNGHSACNVKKGNAAGVKKEMLDKLKPIKCTVAGCSKTFTSEAVLKLHVKAHTSGHKCTPCNQVFTTKTKFDAHMRKHTGERLECPECGRKYLHSGSLSAHMHVHI